MGIDADIDNVLSIAKDHAKKTHKRDSGERRDESRSPSSYYERDRDRERGRERHKEKDRERTTHRDRSSRRRSKDDRDSHKRSPKDKSTKTSTKRVINNDYPFERALRFSPERDTVWDCPPIGYEHMTTAEFKELRASGALPLMQPNEVGGGNIFQRLCVANLPEDCTEKSIQEFFNENMRKAKLVIHPGECCIATQLNSNKSYALVHFRSQEETNNALVFDGAIFNGVPLNVRRSKDYIPPVGMIHQGSGAMTGMLADSLNKLFVACLPTYLDDDQVKELLQAFGELKAFNLVKDGITGISKGYAFCEYIDPAVTDLAIAGLHQMQVGDKRLVVQRAVLGAKNSLHYNAFMMSQLQVPGIDATKIGATQEAEATHVVCLMNMVTIDDLVNDEEFEEIFDDIKTECSKFGNVVSMVIPRPEKDQDVIGLEKIFIEYDSIESARSAYSALAGRKFSGRIVITSFYDENKYFKKEY